MATKAATTKPSASKSTEKKPAPKAKAEKPAPAKAPAPAAPAVVLAEGDPAPAFSLPGAGGATLSLSGLAGKKLVLYFYPKDDTSGCTKEAIEFNALRDKFAKAKTAIVGMSPDSVKSHDKFREKYELAFPLASDETKETLAAFGVWVEKSMYGRKYMGVERATFLIGADGKIAKVWRKVKVPGHAEEVLKAAEAL
ncbi:peroxiredoxin [Methylocystis parvus]|uniref:thioredoxin-dependent peroxiredoxin n=1 Tax=Methylocystis parvus TaxID=134 RepID=A0A6B8M8N3_9HYPH|nr:peroxiredoxin [Methylocystis parvus]